MSAFLPFSPERVHHYVQTMYDAVYTVNRDSAGFRHLEKCIELSITGDGEKMEQAPVNFWLTVKAGIEYTIDYMTYEMPREEFNQEIYDNAFRELGLIVDWLELVTGRHYRPELMNE